jgi:hypothetical protein
MDRVSHARSLLLVLLLWVGAGQPASAWSQLGHALVGDLAELGLTEAAREQVRELLAGEDDPTLGGIASWADGLRYSDPARFSATSSWHYVNARGGGCAFDLARDCAGGKCIVAALLEQERLLADRAQAPGVRRDALKFLVHLVGDLHQPLHAGSRTDSGGNRFQVSLRTDIAPERHARSSYRDGVMGTNLHAVWDHYVLAAANLDRQQYFERLKSRMRERPPHANRATAMTWARESCALVNSQRLYPDTHTMDHGYLDAKRRFAEGRVVTAAARLAAVLNAALAAPAAQGSRSRSR